MRQETFSADITVAGGGLAGVCAAVAAARLGQTVALVQNRLVLGGNSSSVVRVWVCGATKHGVNRYARESGIMGELFTENQYRNPDGNPYLWDAVVLDLVLAEPNITLFLNTDIYDVESEELVFATNESKESESKEKGQQRMIRAVTGWMTGSERRIRFESSVFLDCTGDGLVGFLAGAKYRLGRESQQEFGESLAPETADMTLLGSTILFYTRDTGHSVKYVPPSFAKDIRQTPIPKSRILRSGDSGCHYWWIEWGGELDTVHDNERIRDELWDTGKPQNYVPASLQASCETAVSAGDQQWVEARLPWAPDQAANAFLIVRANEHVSLYMSHQPLSGVLSFIQDQAVCSSSGLHGYVRASAMLEWTMRSGATSMVRKCFCFRIIEETNSYAPPNIINGHVRPYGGPNMWVSDPLLAGQEAWIELRVPQKTIVREIHCTFNDDVNEDLINLHHHRAPFEVMPELVRHYRIEAFTDGSWVTLHTERNNRKRKRIHEIRNPVATDQLRLVVKATHGCPRAEIVEIRLYEQNLSVHER